MPFEDWSFAINLDVPSKGGSAVGWHGQGKTAAQKVVCRCSDWPAQSGMGVDVDGKAAIGSGRALGCCAGCIDAAIVVPSRAVSSEKRGLLAGVEGRVLCRIEAGNSGLGCPGCSCRVSCQCCGLRVLAQPSLHLRLGGGGFFSSFLVLCREHGLNGVQTQGTEITYYS